MVATNPKYRNRRELYYTDKFPDSQGIGTIIQVLKSVEGSFDHEYVPAIVPSLEGGTTAYTEIAGDAEPENNPEYQYPGYIYCDGSEYYIHDYPALFEAIGNDYGGTASDGIDITNGGAGWGGTVTVTIDAPPSGASQVFAGITPVQATAVATIVNGVISGVEVLNPGKGYDPENPPTVTFSATNGGTTPTYNIRISSDVGQIQNITKSNIWEYWPDTNMGTFRVPDLIAKRIVGNGPVYGSNTPNVGNSELGVGINTIDGNWYMDKNTQKNQFSLGNITTTGYTNVVETVEASIIGAQVVSVELQEKKIAGAPQHSHFLLHSEAPQDTPSPQAVSGDRYTVSYKASTGKVNSFLPPGGIAYNHTHVLSKAPILDGSVGTYDIYNWSGGDQDSGSIKEEGYYYASGGAGAGSYVEQTDYGTPSNKKFSSVSLVGGRTIITNGVPVYDTTDVTYSSAGNYTASVPADIDQATVTLVGAGGSGASYSTAGNSGGGSSFAIGNGTPLTMTAGGGSGGGAASTNSGGNGGNAGTQSITGTFSGDVVTTQNGTGSGGNGGDGGDGPYWNVNLNDTGVVPANSEGTAGQNVTGVNGTKGRSRAVSSTADVVTQFTYAGGSDQSFTANPSSSNYGIISLTFELAGGGGRDCGNFGGNGCGAAGEGGAGRYFKANYGNPTSGTIFKIQPGQSGRVYNAPANATHSGKGGRAGDGYQSNDGGGGGAATIVRLQSGNVIIAGAGGGGGGGGFGEGSCGQNGRSNPNPGDTVIQTTQALFTGGGATGGGYGCTGGGGGGGGGGCGRAGDNAGGTAGAGGGGSGGHEEGYGGFRGVSAVRSDYFSSVVSQGNTNNGDGYVTVTLKEDRGYWTSGGGGGGSGGLLVSQIPASAFAGQSSVSITVGEGGAGVNNGGTSSSAGSDGYAKISWQTIAGYEGGTESISIGDVFIAGSGNQDNGVNFYSSGVGTNSTNGFKLPTTQAPTIIFEGGGGGSGAAATAQVSGNKISSITLTNSGSGYTEAPRVRILNGVGVNNYATVGFSEVTGQLQGLTLVSSDEPTTYLKFGGTQSTRFVTLDTVDASDIKRLTVKAARGNDKNGGETPENGGDELFLYYNTNESLNFPSSGFIGQLVPIPTTAQLNSDYDGTGTGGNPTNWYTYSIDLPAAAKTETTRFSIRQTRAQGTDQSTNSDNYGILEITYENDQTTELVFVASEGQIPISGDTQTYSVGGAAGSTYTSGIFANDLTLTLSSATPIIPTAVLDPDQVIPLIEPYFLVKYLIKAF